MKKQSRYKISSAYQSNGKHGKRNVQPSLYSMTPTWSFLRCDFDHKKWGVAYYNDYLVELLKRFKEWERATWGDVLTPTAGRKGGTQSHQIPVANLVREAGKRLSELNLDENDILYSLAITGRRRVWGIMIEETGTFQLLWCDPNHEIYPVER